MNTNEKLAVKPTAKKTARQPVTKPDPYEDLKAICAQNSCSIEELTRENCNLRRELAQLNEQVRELSKLVKSPVKLNIRGCIDYSSPERWLMLTGKLRVNGQVEDVNW